MGIPRASGVSAEKQTGPISISQYHLCPSPGQSTGCRWHRPSRSAPAGSCVRMPGSEGPLGCPSCTSPGVAVCGKGPRSECRTSAPSAAGRECVEVSRVSVGLRIKPCPFYSQPIGQNWSHDSTQLQGVPEAGDPCIGDGRGQDPGENLGILQLRPHQLPVPLGIFLQIPLGL